MLNLLALSIIELIFGIGWGIVASIYAYTMVSSGLESIYGTAAITISLTAVLSILISGALYYKGSGKYLMPIAAIFLSTAVINVLDADVTLLPLLLGLSSGIHGVSTLFAVSNMEGDHRRYSAVYSSGLLGFSLGSLLVALNFINEIHTAIAIAILIGGLAYPKFVQTKYKEKPKVHRNSRTDYILAFTLLRRGSWNVCV